MYQTPNKSSMKKRRSILRNDGSQDGISFVRRVREHCPFAENEVNVTRRIIPRSSRRFQDESSIEEKYGDKEEEVPSSKSFARHGYHMVRGKMEHGMEDYVVAENRKINGHELGLYAIFDGHSGRDVAQSLQSHLFDNILNESDFWKNPKRAIKKACKTADYEILDAVGPRGGSTAVTAILIDQEKLVVANVGDSRAILCRAGVARQLSVDHEPQKGKELVESRGGFASERPGNVPRVDGQLAMIGALKEHITSEPDLITKMIDDDAELLILASDGLWKVMSNQEAYDCIRELEAARQAVERLIEEALARGSRDHISCIVVIFQ